MSPVLKSFFCLAALCLCAPGQEAPAKDAAANQAKGLPPRTAPTEYQAHTQAGTVTIAAEFKGHSVPTMQSPLTTEDYIVVETGLYGPPEARLKLSAEDFTLRINGKKAALSSQPYGLVVGNVKDPEWEPPVPVEKKSKGGGLSTGGQGGGGGDNTPPPPPKVPLEVQRAMAKNVQRAALPEGDRALPQAGLLFFAYRGKASGIHSIELLYTGPAGKTTLPLQP